MIEAYEVGVSLVMSDSILESISLVNSKFLDAQQIIMGGNAALKRMTTLTSGLIGPTNALANAWKNVAAYAAAASAAVDRMNGAPSGGYSPAGTGGTSQRSGGVPGPFTPFGLIAYNPPVMPVDTAKLPAVIPGARPSGRDSWSAYRIPGYGSGGTPTGPDSDSSGYVPNWTSGRPSGEDASFNERPKLTLNPKTAARNSESLTGMGPFMDAGAGIAGVGLLKSVFGAGANMDAVEAYMKAAGWSNSDISAAAKQADAVRKSVKGTNLLQNMQEIYELGSIFGNHQEALKYMPMLMKQAIVANVPTGEDPTDVYNTAFQTAFNLARSAELSGQLINPKTHLIDPEKLTKYAEDIANLSLVTGGRVTATDFVALAQNAGAGVMSQLTPEGLVKLTPLLLSMGGARAGTALNALATQFKGGKMSQASARALHDVGLLPDYMFDKNDKILKKYQYGIGMVEIPPGALPGQALFNKDVAGWLQKVIIPALEAHGLTTPEEQENYLYKIGSRIPGIRALQELIAIAPQIANYTDAASAVQGQNTYADVANNPILESQALSASWQAFMTESGQAWMPDAIKVIDDMTSFMNAAGKLAKEHPTINNTVLGGIGLLSLGALADLGVWFAKIGSKRYVSALKFVGKLDSTATDLAASGEGAAATLGELGSFAIGVGEMGAVFWGANKAADLLNNKLDSIFGITPIPTPPMVVEADNWVRKHLDGIFGINYVPDVAYNQLAGPNNWGGSLAPNAATPPPPQQTQQNGPIPVHVTNSGDIHNGTAKAMIHQLTGRMNGPTGFDYTTNGIAPAGAY